MQALWKDLPSHEGHATDNDCTCDRNNDAIRCFFRRLRSEKLSELTKEEEEKNHIQNCRRIHDAFDQVASSLEQIGGSVWIVASIPHRLVDDMDVTYGEAASTLAADLDKYGINLAALMAANQVHVDIKSNPTFSKSLQSTVSIQQRLAEPDDEPVKPRNQVSSYKILEQQNNIRTLLKGLLASQGVKMTKKEQLPTKWYNQYKVLNWPSQIPSPANLKALKSHECDIVMNVASSLRLLKIGSHKKGVLTKEKKLHLRKLDCVLI